MAREGDHFVKTSDQIRSARPREVPPKTETIRGSRRAIRESPKLHADHEHPVTRGQCVDGPRPCPLVGCKYHLYIDVKKNGHIILNFPDLEPWEMLVSCSLDVADEGAISKRRIAGLLNLTREGVRQIEIGALKKIRLPMIGNKT